MHTRYNSKRLNAIREKAQAMARARWAKDRARRDADQPTRERELAIIEAENLPRRQGDMLGFLQWTDARTGQTRRWTIRIGDRADRLTIEAPGQLPSASHGWTWILNKLRSKLASP
jgi:hypothetical protein